MIVASDQWMDDLFVLLCEVLYIKANLGGKLGDDHSKETEDWLFELVAVIRTHLEANNSPFGEGHTLN